MTTKSLYSKGTGTEGIGGEDEQVTEKEDRSAWARKGMTYAEFGELHEGVDVGLPRIHLGEVAEGFLE